jgi:hypothetical protein
MLGGADALRYRVGVEARPRPRWRAWGREATLAALLGVTLPQATRGPVRAMLAPSALDGRPA